MSQNYIDVQKKIPLHQFILEKAPFTRNVAIHDVHTNKKFCYHQLPSSVFNFGKNLQDKLPTFKKGTKVAVHIHHNYSLAQHLAIYLGTCGAGGCTSFIDPTAPVRHKNQQLIVLKNEILISHWDIFDERILENTPIRFLIFLGAVPPEKLAELKRKTRIGFLPVEPAVKDAEGKVKVEEKGLEVSEPMYEIFLMDEFVRTPVKKKVGEGPTDAKMEDSGDDKKKVDDGTSKEKQSGKKDEEKKQEARGKGGLPEQSIKVCFDIFNDIVCLPFNARNVKCVKFDHSNVIFNLIQLTSIKEITSKDVVLLNFPHFHIFTFLLLFLCLTKGVKVISLPFTSIEEKNKIQFNAKVFSKAVNSHKVTKCYMHIKSILGLYTKIRRSGDIQDLPTLKSITCLGPRVSRVIQAELSERMKVDIKNCYGYVETQFLSFQLDDRVDYKASFNPVGKLLPGTKVRIIDTQTNLLPTGKVGDIAIFGPQCGHYYGEREYKWYKTGDAGKTDQKNQLYVIDQLTNRFAFNSNVFYANELKDLLLAHQEIVDAEVINDNGLIKGFVVKLPVSKISEMELITYVVSSLKENETHKIINQIQFVNQIERDCCGYVEKNKLKKIRNK